MSFTYTAPNQKAPQAGFGMAAVSRAGTAVATWMTGLGTGWSGLISYVKQYTGDQGQNWSNTMSETVTVTVKDGVAEFDGSFEQESVSENFHSVATGGGKVTQQLEGSHLFGDTPRPTCRQQST